MEHTSTAPDAPVSPAVGLAYYAGDSEGSVPLLRPILIAGVVTAALLVARTGWVWVALAMYPRRVLFASDAMIIPGILRGAVAVAAAVTLIGLIGCLRQSPTMRFMTLGGAMTTIVLLLAATIAHFLVVRTQLVSSLTTVQSAIWISGSLSEAVLNLIVPMLIWYVLRRSDVRAIFVDQTLRNR